MIRKNILAFCCVGVLVIGAPAAQAQPQLTLDWRAMAEQLVAQLALEPNERVLLVAAPGLFDDLIPVLRYFLFAGPLLRLHRPAAVKIIFMLSHLPAIFGDINRSPIRAS